jgi:hypothetical protein
LSIERGQATVIRVLLSTVTIGVPGTVGGVVSELVARVVALPAADAFDTLPAASKARTVYE